MRICVICHEATLTGAPRVGFEIALFLAKSHEVHLVLKTGGPLLEQPRYATLKATCRVTNTYVRAAELSYPDRVEKAVRVLQEIRPDLVYVNSVCAGDWCEAGARVGSVVVLHTYEMSKALPFLLGELADPRILTWVDMLVGHGRRAPDDIQQLTGVQVETHMILDIFGNPEAILAQGGVDVEPPLNAKGEPLGHDRRRVAMCGTAELRKGADIFFDLASRLPLYDFIWIGPWGPPDAMHNDATFERFRAQLLDNFYVTGLTEYPGAYLRQIDALLLTSREDTNPLVVAEALLFGRKVIAFSETGDSKVLLERFGYVLSGVPDSTRAAAILPKIIEGENGPWLLRLADEVKSEIDPAPKLHRLQERLENLVQEQRKEIARKVAAEANVSPAIHPDDYLFSYTMECIPFANKEQAITYYFTRGREAAHDFADLLKELMPLSPSLDLLEFASGYGSVGRHWKNIIPEARVTCCDIHAEAVRFMGDELGLSAALSSHIPEELNLPEAAYDAIFVLSFFSHMPRVTWGRWLKVLFQRLRPGGCLVFTTHGPSTAPDIFQCEVSDLPNQEEGFWFKAVSEQKDLSLDEYGTSLVTSDFVFKEAEKMLGTQHIVYRPRPKRYFGEHQDLYIVRK